jgi:hypothetical protein
MRGSPLGRVKNFWLAVLLAGMPGILPGQSCAPSIQSLNNFSGESTQNTGLTQYTFDRMGGSTGTAKDGTTVNPISVIVGGSNPSSCGAWTATASAPWVQITSGASGSGAGTTSYTVAVNPGAPRNATISFTWASASPSPIVLLFTIYQTGAVLALPSSYRIDFRYNAAGCGSNAPNPFQCVTEVGSGPYFLTVDPGAYTITAGMVGPDGSFQTSAWVGNSSTGTQYVLGPSAVTVTVAAGQQLVLYALDSFAADNDPNDWVDFTVAPAFSGPQFASGDVFAGVGAGRDFRFASSGILLQTMTSGFVNSSTRGMAFDSAGNLYSANTDANAIVRFDNKGNPLGPFGSGYTRPESIVFDASGNSYVGQDDNTGRVLKLNPSGAQLGSFLLAKENAGSNWIDLTSDQSTLFYTSGGPSIKRFNVLTATQLTDFANVGGVLGALRLLGDGGLIVAHNTATSANILRLNSGGTVIQTYSFLLPDPTQYSLTDLRLDPDGTSFWTASAGGATGNRIYKVDLASGTILQSFDPGNPAGTQGLEVFGEPSPNNVVITTGCPLPPATVGVAYSQALTAGGGGGAATYSWSISNGILPPGLAISGQFLRGVPLAAPGTNFTLFVASPVTPPGTSGSQIILSASKPCSIAVNQTAVLSLSGTCPAGSVGIGTTVSIPLTASGGNGNYRLVYSGPAWLALSATSGTASNGSFVVNLSGSPPGAGTFPFTVTLTDSSQTASVVFQCTIQVVNSSPPPTVAIQLGCPVSTATLGLAYSAGVPTAGGVGGFVWSISNGALPPGLSFSGGLISGVPSAAGTFPFNISVASGGQNATIACSIRVAPAPLYLTSGCPAGGVQGTGYGPFSLAATGGLGPNTYSFGIVNGSLPAGVVLVNNTIGGTPSAAGTFTFTIQVTSGPVFATVGPCSVTIAPPASPPLSALNLSGSCPANPLAAGAPVSVSLSATGGKPPYTFQLTGPAWLTVSNNGGTATVTGTPPSAGKYPFSVTLTDSANSTPAVFSCTLAVNPTPLQIGGSCPASPLSASSPFSLPLTAAGGNGIYNWTLSGPSWLSLLQATGGSTSLSGTPAAPGTFPLSVTLTDSAGSAPATFSCTLTVNLPALQISPAGAGCPTAPLAPPANISISLVAEGGQPPYNWKLAGPTWLSLSASAGGNTVVSGVPPSQGTYPFSVTLGDSGGSAPATFSCTVIVSPAVIPPITITTQNPATPPNPVSVGVGLAAPSPVPLQGVAQLTFTSSAVEPGGVTDNPLVVFSDPTATNQGRTLAFTIPAGSQTVPPFSIQQGTVAGTISVEIVSLMDGDRNVLPVPHPSTQVVVPSLPPVITNVAFENETSTGFDIVISGYSPPRDLSTATVTFTASAGASVEGGTSFPVDVSAVTRAFYTSAASVAGGSAFTGLRLPVSIDGDKTAIASVTVTLTNSAGTSDPVTKSR